MGTITIRELNETRESVERARQAIQDANKPFQAAIEVLKTAGVDPKTIDIVRAELMPVGRAMQSAGEQLYSYRILLDDIAGTTKIAWPPACQTENT